jgi:VCBS repeat-containing protein
VNVQLITSAGVVRVPKPGELLSSVGTAATGLSEIRYTPSTNYNNLIDGPVLVLVTIEDTGVTGDTDPSAGNLVPTPDPKQATSTLTININAMNDRPIVTLDPSMTMANLANRRFDIFGNLVGAQLDVLEDPGPQSIPLTVTAGPAGIVGAAVGVSGGADDENGRVPPPVFGQNVSFNTPGNLRVRALNPSLFRVQPTISPATGASVNRTLSFELAPDVNKLFIANPIQIVIFGLDDGQPAGDGSLGGRHENESVPLTLTLNVAPINDAPEFTVPTSDINGNIIVESNEDEGLVTRLRFATDIRPGTTTSLVDEGVQSLVFDVLAFEPSVFAIQPTIDVDGTLSFQTAQDLNTKANSIGSKDRRVLVTLRDNGVSGPSPNTNVSIARTFTMVIKPTNDPPVPRSNYQVNPAPSEDTRITVQAADILAGAIPGPPDEVSDGQTLRVTNVNQVSGQGGTVLPDYGTDPDGVRRLRKFDYIPPLNFVGVDTITYILSDVFPADPSLRYPPGQLSVTGTITLTVQGINDPPEFTSGGNVSVVEDSPQYNAPWATNIAVGPPSATDEISGPNSQVIDRFEVAITNGRQDLFSVLPAISPDGVLTFTLAKDANGIATVSAVAVDNGPGNAPNNNRSRPVTFTINVTAVNDEPDFVVNKLVVQRTEDSGAVTEPSVLTRIVPAIGNNATPQTALDELTTQTVSITTRLKTGSSSLFAVQPSVNASGTLTFTTAPNQIGTAVFEVFATDSGSNLLPNRNTSAVKEFTIVISADNDAPTAVDDPYSTSETTVLTRNAAQGLLQNDIDPEGDPLAIASSATVSEFGAQVRVNVDGSFTYNPTNPAISPRIKALVDGQTLTDTFTYTARDTLPNGAPKPDSKESNVATVTVTVSGFNDAPVAVNDPFGVPFNTTRLLNVLANDFDVDTPINVASIEIGVLPVNGTATPTAEGRIRYTPRTDFRGLDTFTYRVRDSLGKVSNEATVTVRVNTAPVANPDSRLVEKNVATLIDVLSNDVDPDGTLNPATLQIVATPLQGTTTVVNGQIQFTPFSGFEGITTFQYVVSDNDGLASNTATVTVQVVASLYQNPSRRTDVNNDGFVSPLDALILINLINSNSGTPVPVGSLPKPDISRPGPPDFVDVNANGTVDPLDVLEVINFINSGGANGEGEGEGKGDASASIAPTGLAWSFLTGTTSVDTHAASLSNDAGNMMAGSRVSTLANAAQPLTNASWSSAQMSLADYLASLTDEEEELIDGALDLDLRTGDRDAIDDAFADLFGE